MGEVAPLPESFRLVTTSDQFVLEPSNPKLHSSRLEIDRTTGTFAVRPAGGPAAGSPGTTQEIFGLVGIIRLLGGPYLVVITKRQLVGLLQGHQVWRVAATKIIPFVTTRLSNERQRDEARYLAMLRNILATKYFYFSTTCDITTRLQVRLSKEKSGSEEEPRSAALWEKVDPRFFWNKHLSKDLIANQLDQWILPLMMGYIHIENDIRLGDSVFDYVLISRRNLNRAGTRYNVRGVDEKGEVANNVETEQILLVKQRGSVAASRATTAVDCCSFVQTRGSIPIFWNQHPDISYKPRAHIRPTKTHSARSIALHFDKQISQYGRQVLVNLINQKGSEGALAQEYENHVNQLEVVSKLRYVAFDFHKECKQNWNRLHDLMDNLQDDIEKFGFLSFDTNDHNIATSQDGVFRTNCIDNLDRTNVVQSMLARRSLELQLRYVGILAKGDTITNHPDLDSRLKHVWANNADTISFQYAGTGALKTDFTRTGKRTLRGVVNDGANSVTRYFLNNFKDGFRQDSFDLFLGNYIVDEQSAITTSPFNNYRPVLTIICMIAILIGAVMFLASIFTPQEEAGIVYQILVILFWLSGLAASAKILMLYGPDLVDRPQLGVHPWRPWTSTPKANNSSKSVAAPHDD
ncbi:Phosphatidylinositide phosphatase SAC1 [Balamuthia mandrillaris]